MLQEQPDKKQVSFPHLLFSHWLPIVNVWLKCLFLLENVNYFI